jgi:predicted nucleic acid-binding protein
MILLDTNVLIDLLSENSKILSQVDSWVKANIKLSTSVLCWAEFLTGPVDHNNISLVDYLIEGRIIEFSKSEAECSSDLYNKSGRKRSNRIDTFIAATAIVNNLELATLNTDDFIQFKKYGLSLAL